MGFIRENMKRASTESLYRIVGMFSPEKRGVLFDAFSEKSSFSKEQIQGDMDFLYFLTEIKYNSLNSKDKEKSFENLIEIIHDAIHDNPQIPRDVSEEVQPEEPSGNSGKDQVVKLESEISKKEAPEVHKASSPCGRRIRIFPSATVNGSVHLISLLSPPPSDQKIEHLERWLNFDPEVNGIAIFLDGDDWAEKATDFEVDLYNDPENFLSLRSVKKPLDESMFRMYGDWVRENSSDYPDSLDENILENVRECFEFIIAKYFPSHPGFLSKSSAEIILSEDSCRMISFACELESQFLQDCDPDEENMKSDQDYLSSAHPARSIVSGHILKQAFGRFLVASMPIDAALGISLVEMRDAQLQRIAGEEAEKNIAKNFDELFFDDCRRPLESFIVEPDHVLEM